mmetsp:Transcript_84956/g.254685  ORF Transcript_84956/g.254685 Transcript_84956/m.254685 type:complete len:279 (-) Transcript_84956:243-1079(-)
MTDGAGRISLNLAVGIPHVLGGELQSTPRGEAPLATQGRFYFLGSLAKGMLVTDRTLPKGYVIMTESMLKIHGRPGCKAAQFGFCSFEVNNTSDLCPRARFNANLVPLLEHGALMTRGEEGRQALIDHLRTLQQHERELLRVLADKGMGIEAAAKKKAAAKLLGHDLQDLHDAGWSWGEIASEPHLMHKLQRAASDQLTPLRLGKFAIPNSYCYLGVPDHLGVLNEGEVCVLRNGVWSQAAGTTEGNYGLMFKSPGCTKGRRAQGAQRLPAGAARHAH